MSDFFSSAAVLLRREVVRFLRQRNRIVGALGTPLLFWFLIGSGLGKSFHVPAAGGGEGLTYLQYFFPGTLLLTVLFTAIFSAISIIEDRREGFLQAVLVSPAPRGALVLGKLLGGTLLALFQGGLLLLMGPWLGMTPTAAGLSEAVLVLFFTAFGLTGLGFLAAWRLDSVQGFHAVMNLVLMPLWFLSGALFPASGAPAWLRALMKVNPLGHAVDALHRTLYPAVWHGGGSAATALLVTGGFAALMFVSCAVFVGQGGDK